MPILREQDFDKIATRVVDRFMSGKAKLAEAAAEEAVGASMNPDQIDRLSQSANVMAFLRMMDKQKEQGNPDLTQEFDPIDARKVIKIIIDNTGVHVEDESGGDTSQGEMHPGGGMHPGGEIGEGAPPPMGGELPDEMQAMRGDEPPKGMPHGMNPAEGEPGHEDSPEVEECEEDCHDALDPAGVKTEKKNKSPFPKKDKKKEKSEGQKKEASWIQSQRAIKVATVLEDQLREAEWAFQDLGNSLTTMFKRASAPMAFEAFEKDALAECDGPVGLQVLNMLREERGMPAMDSNTAQTKTAALQDRHITEDSRELAVFEKLVKIASEAIRLQEALEHVRSQCV